MSISTLAEPLTVEVNLPFSTPEEVAEKCVKTIISISEDANPAIRAQAHAFRRQILKTVELYMREAVKSDRTTVHNALIQAGHPELAHLIRRR